MRTPSSSLREMLLAKAGRSLCGRLSLCVCVRVHGDRRRISHGHRAGLRIIRQLFAGHRFLQRRAVFEVRQFYMRALATDAHREIKQIFPKDTCKANMDTSHKPASLHQDRVRVRVRVEKRADQELERPAAEGVRDGVTCELWKLKHATVRRKVDLISVQPSHRIAHRCAPPQRHISTIAAAAGCRLLAAGRTGKWTDPWTLAHSRCLEWGVPPAVIYTGLRVRVRDPAGCTFAGAVRGGSISACAGAGAGADGPSRLYLYLRWRVRGRGKGVMWARVVFCKSHVVRARCAAARRGPSAISPCGHAGHAGAVRCPDAQYSPAPHVRAWVYTCDLATALAGGRAGGRTVLDRYS